MMTDRIDSLVPGGWHDREGMRKMARRLQEDAKRPTFKGISAAESFIPGLVQELDALTDAADERQAAIVAWLRDKALTAPGEWGPIVASVMDGCADAIEAGEWKGQG